MTTTTIERSLAEKIFAPESVALIGASDNPAKLISYRPIDYLKRHGYTGPIYPINPNRATVQGLPAYPSILETPTVPEFVVVALPREHVLPALEDCARAGAAVVVIYSSGFSEVPDGYEMHAQLTEFAQRTGVRVIGPNCQGVAHFTSGFLPSFSTTFSGTALATGPAAIVSQSGAMAGMIYNQWAAVGGGITHWASTGNEADVTVAELATSIIEDRTVECLFLYLESVRGGEHLALLAQRARELDKHVVLFRPARTTRGWQAAARHTGAGVMPADRQSLDLPVSSHLHLADSIEHLVAIGQVVQSRKSLAGSSIGIISNSGGLGVATADAAVEAGFSVDALASSTHDVLSGILPGFASVENPVDITAQLLNDPSLLSTALPAMLRDPKVDAIAVSLGAVGDGYDAEQIVTDIVAAQQHSDKLIVVCWVGSRIDVRKVLGSARVPVFTRIDDTIAALRAISPPRLPSAADSGPPAPHFDDLFVGARYTLGPLVIDASDLDHYARAARQTNDTTNIHVDLDAARAAGFDARVVSGLHTLTAITVLGQEAGLWENSVVVAGFNHVRFVRPVLEGDAVDILLTVTSTKPLKDRRGLVTFDFVISCGSPAATGSVTYVFRARESEDR